MSAVEHMLILWNVQATSSLGKKYFCNGVDLSNIMKFSGKRLKFGISTLYTLHLLLMSFFTWVVWDCFTKWLCLGLQLKFEEDLKITRMYSAEGEDVAFMETLYPTGNVEDWMLEIERCMKESLRIIIRDSLKDYKEVYVLFIKHWGIPFKTFNNRRKSFKDCKKIIDITFNIPCSFEVNLKQRKEHFINCKKNLFVLIFYVLQIFYRLRERIGCWSGPVRLWSLDVRRTGHQKLRRPWRTSVWKRVTRNCWVSWTTCETWSGWTWRRSREWRCLHLLS